ncbi:MAG TPA: PsbP-related protein [Edaphocola sp.]|nr:PsbP-related protein [Edaphocola sp.]
MTDKLFSILIFSIFISSSSQSQTRTNQISDTSQASQNITEQQPNFNYVVEVPDDWTIRDTVMLDSMRIRFLFSPQSLSADYPAGNILVVSMEGRNIDDFTTRNINYLQSNMPGIVILERGNIDSTIYNGEWFTYTKEQNGVARDMINYIIPLNGFAYMITCASNKGSIDKYRTTFDKIAHSFIVK